MKSLGAWLAALFLLSQLSIPVYVISRDELSSRDFSWDMFSYQLTCEAFQISSKVDDGPVQPVRLERDFSSFAQLRRVLSPQRFEAYAQKLCHALQVDQPRSVELRVYSRCSTDRDTAAFSLFNSERNFCQTR